MHAREHISVFQRVSVAMSFRMTDYMQLTDMCVWHCTHTSITTSPSLSHCQIRQPSRVICFYLLSHTITGKWQLEQRCIWAPSKPKGGKGTATWQSCPFKAVDKAADGPGGTGGEVINTKRVLKWWKNLRHLVCRNRGCDTMEIREKQHILWERVDTTGSYTVL